jgi:hypothetical protein
MPFRPFCRLLSLLVCLGGPAHAAEESLTAVWRQVAAFFTKEGLWALQALPPTADAATQRERDFCHAVILFDLQPLTETRLDDAERRLQPLAAGDDEIARAARYLLARSQQIYRQQPDPAAAAELYRSLSAQPGGGSWAELARVKLALLELYALPASGPPARLKAAPALLAEAQDTTTRRDLHRLLARAVLFYDLDPAGALTHLEAAEAIGGLQGEPHADQLVQLAELNWELQHRERAIHFHARLAAEYPRDVRAWGLAEKLAGRPGPARGRPQDGP